VFPASSGLNFDRGEWAYALLQYYKKKPYLLTCPVATMRRGEPKAGPGETRLSLDDPAAVDNGGPTTAYNFPLVDPEAPPNAKTRELAASYGANNWVYNPPPGTADIQGRPAGYHWRKLHLAKNPPDTPLMG